MTHGQKNIKWFNAGSFPFEKPQFRAKVFTCGEEWQWQGYVESARLTLIWSEQVVLRTPWRTSSQTMILPVHILKTRIVSECLWTGTSSFHIWFQPLTEIMTSENVKIGLSKSIKQVLFTHKFSCYRNSTFTVAFTSTHHEVIKICIACFFKKACIFRSFPHCD